MKKLMLMVLVLMALPSSAGMTWKGYKESKVAGGIRWEMTQAYFLEFLVAMDTQTRK